MNSKFLTLMICLLMGTTALAGCLGGDDETETENNTIKIGLLSPSTGPIAVYAAGFEDAAAVAIADLNTAHPDSVFELVVADSGCDGTVAATAAQTLIDSGVIGIAGAACSGATLGAIAVAKEAGVPMVSYASTSPAVTLADDGGLLFRVVPSDAQQSVALAQVLMVMGATMNDGVGVLYMTNDYGSGLADNFEVAMGGDLCAKTGYDPTDFDASTLATAVADCDAVILMSYATDGAAIIEELATQEFEGDIFGGDGIADANFGNEFSDTDALDGVVATQPRPGVDSAVKTAFTTNYEAAGGDAAGIYTHETYDAVTIIGMAALADSTDMAASIAAVGVNFDGASGSHTFDANGDVLGTGYNVCLFTTEETVSFDCLVTWTAADGLAVDTTVPFDGPTIKIGLLTPATGPIAVYSAGFEAATTMMINALNLAWVGEVNFELVVADSGCDGTVAATAAQTLIDSGVVGIVGAACSGASLGAIAVAKEAGIPMISYASTSPALTDADDNGMLFRVVPSDAQQSIALADVVTASGANSSTTAVLYMTNDYGAGLADNFNSSMGGELCAMVGYDPTDFDASTLATAVADCDSVVLMSYATDGAAIVEELATQGYTGSMFGADGIADAAFIAEFSDNSTLNGLVATKPNAGEAPMAALFDALWAMNGGPEGAIYTHEAADATMIIAMAAATTMMMQAEGNANFTIVDGINMMTAYEPFEGASGMHVFDANGDVLGSGYEVCSFDDEAGVTVFSCSATWTQEDGLADNAA